MQRVAPQLGPLETRLMAWAQMLDVRRATSDEIAAGLRLDKIQCRKLLDRMNKRGRVVQLQRGLYLLPAKLPSGGQWTPAPAVILHNLFEAKGGQWQETGVGAFHFHGLGEQVPNTTSVYNTLYSKRDRIAGLEFEMIKVAPSRLGSVTEADGRRIGTLGRVVMDAIFDSSRFGTLPKAYDWIRDRRDDEGFLNELVDCCIRHADAPTRRRVGCVLEMLEAGGKRLDKLQKKTPATRSVIPLVPGGNRVGTINKRWGVILNQTDWLHG